MKGLILGIILITSYGVYAKKGSERGNGGEKYANQFTKSARKAHKKAKGILSQNQLDRYEKALDDVQVFTVEHKLCIDDKDLSCPGEAGFVAKNYRKSEKIKLNKLKWISLNPSEKMEIAFHEYLGILGIESGTYHVTSKLTENIRVQAIMKKWKIASDAFNDMAYIAEEFQWEFFAFGNESKEHFYQMEKELVEIYCGEGNTKDLFYDKLSRRKMLDNYLPDIINEMVIALALFTGADWGINRTMREKLEFINMVNMFTSVITELVADSENIYNVGSSGDCQGAWGHSHQVIETSYGRFSISLGGGE